MEPHERDEIAGWLEAGPQADYRTGVLLLQQHNPNRSLVNMLLRKESTSNRAKLTYELTKCACAGNLEHVREVMGLLGIASQDVPAAAQAVVHVPHLVHPTQPQQIPAAMLAEAPEPEQVPEAVRAEVDELTLLMQQLHNQRCKRSNSLADLDPAEGPRVVAEVLSLQNQYNALAEKRRLLVAGEASPEQPGASETPAGDAPAADVQQPSEQPGEQPAGPSRAELLQERANLRSRVSKAKKAAEAKPDDQLKAEKYAKLQAELAELDLQIKALDA